MHIPDGYLSPTTAVTMCVISIPFLVKASGEIKKKFNRSSLPFVGVFGAFSFLIMMFNLPLPGGTTGHAVGSVLTSIVLGPWLSMLSISLALVIQALFFGDGGILALGANIFNMAIAMSLVGYGVFIVFKKLFREKISDAVSAGLAGYIAINIAALLTGIELGIQPLLFKNAAGRALYFPYPLWVSVPAMLLGHLLIAGFAEAAVASFGYQWMVRQYPVLLHEKKHVAQSNMGNILLGITILIFLAPMGLLAPGTAWGEWSREELSKMGIGYIPAGFDKWNSLWRAPIPDYDISILHNSTVAYLVSALMGVALIIGIFIGVQWILARIDKPQAD
jgi:cobalt/nickel transport system permease protein